MDTLLSPRRRRVIQALGACALLAGCGAKDEPKKSAPGATPPPPEVDSKTSETNQLL